MTDDQVLDPNIPIIDAHHHLYRYPGKFLPKRRYMIEDFERDLESGHNVVASVYLECGFMHYQHGPEWLRTVGEAAYVDSIARLSATGLYGKTRMCAAFVGEADLTRGAAVGEVLDALDMASGGRLRGIRLVANWDADSTVNTGTRAMAPSALFQDPALHAGLAQMQARGLVCDAWQYFPQLPGLGGLADAFPEMTFVANHCGGVLGIGSYDRRESFAAWKDAIAEVAARPNVLIKLGGMAGARNGFGYQDRPAPSLDELVDDWSPYFQACIEAFGADRCLFESNFPVDMVAADYRTLWNVFKRCVADHSLADRTAMLSGNAARLYRIELT